MSNPDWYLDPPDEPDTAECSECHKDKPGFEIEYYPEYKKWICVDCIDEYEEQRRFCPECGYIWVDCQCGL